MVEVYAENIMHRILTRMNFVEDMIMYSKFAIYLASLQEDLGEFRSAVQTLRAAIGKMVEYREERMKQTLDSKYQICRMRCRSASRSSRTRTCSKRVSNYIEEDYEAKDYPDLRQVLHRAGVDRALSAL
jgi:hypothetical protein